MGRPGGTAAPRALWAPGLTRARHIGTGYPDPSLISPRQRGLPIFCADHLSPPGARSRVGQVAAYGGCVQAHKVAPDVAPLCGVLWGICPDHGPTLTGSAGRSWCQFPECDRRWSYDRLNQPCAELATHRITDRVGGSITEPFQLAPRSGDGCLGSDQVRAASAARLKSELKRLTACEVHAAEGGQQIDGAAVEPLPS